MTIQQTLRIDGRVLLPGDAGYDDHRKALNPALDPRPAVVVRAAGTADVRRAVLAARRHALPFAVQATGHGTHVAHDGALLLHTGAMAAVVVDPDRRIARVGPGARWGDVLRAAAPFGLAPLSGSSPDVGVTGYTLGGGLGWLARAHGLAADSVLRAQLVTADGTLRTVSADRDPDLFWALCGGGGSFGVVTALEFRLYPVTRVYAGALTFGRDRAAETLGYYRQWIERVPDALSSAVLLTRDGSLVLKAMYAGDPDRGRALLEPLRTVAGPVLDDGMRVVDYAHAAMGGTFARTFDQVRTLDDDLLAALLDEPDSTVEIRHWGGRIARDSGAAAHRDAPLSIVLDTVASARTAAALDRCGIGSGFLNFLHDPSRMPSAFTAGNWAALRRIKAAHDPDNVFGAGLAVPPAVLTAA
ncbi:FAD/FMN-containing dehydrogenase [Micromonospora echinaurantiaca]|uniref:FAD/FMN-containing dehydrogenase n=1 Tax=Micromonospora echinaurantiaca TaxID=47857 RepID=A0A1C5J239_9ACTN|nr:FAD-dependent oxidoreductase [Micromonospora echinaurantiaca]SCG64657.1 FAD/FMN-containing dehydrogenase [Micromonospora echinaurantiaca]